MIEGLHVQQRKDLLQSLLQQFVGAARFGEAGGMVMREDDRRRVVS
jgi:hypothetical protein